jgi:hypothetical protein
MIMDKNILKKLEELESRVAILEKNNATRKIPSGLKIGDTFELVGTIWKILDITNYGYSCLADSIKEMDFDTESNNWTNSNLRNYLVTEFLDKLKEEIGEDNILQRERDLLSLDGQTEYGKAYEKISLLTVDEYRKYRSLIPNTDDEWWWLITTWSTPCNDYDTGVTAVSPNGDIGYVNCYDYCSVRPFCIFSSSIFESEE